MQTWSPTMKKMITDRNAGRQAYIASKMRGEPLMNFPAFAEAAKALRSAGYKVFSPAEEDLKKGFDPATGQYPGYTEGETLRQVMLADLSWICQFADLVVVFGKWRQSKGVRAEVHTADAIGIPVYELEDVLAGNMRKVVL